MVYQNLGSGPINMAVLVSRNLCAGKAQAPLFKLFLGYLAILNANAVILIGPDPNLKPQF